jgi:hypothetical protein
MDQSTSQAPATEPKAKKSKAPSSAEAISVKEHKARLPQDKRFLHAAASALHGWKEHEHDTGEPMQLTEGEYQSALECAAHRDPYTGKYEPSSSALAPIKAKRAERAREDQIARAKSAIFERTQAEQLQKARLEARNKAKAEAKASRKGGQ